MSRKDEDLLPLEIELSTLPCQLQHPLLLLEVEKTHQHRPRPFALFQSLPQGTVRSVQLWCFCELVHKKFGHICPGRSPFRALRNPHNPNIISTGQAFKVIHFSLQFGLCSVSEGSTADLRAVSLSLWLVSTPLQLVVEVHTFPLPHVQLLMWLEASVFKDT